MRTPIWNDLKSNDALLTSGAGGICTNLNAHRLESKCKIDSLPAKCSLTANYLRSYITNQEHTWPTAVQRPMTCELKTLDGLAFFCPPLCCLWELRPHSPKRGRCNPLVS